MAGIIHEMPVRNLRSRTVSGRMKIIIFYGLAKGVLTDGRGAD